MVNMGVPYRGPDGLSQQLLSELQARFGVRAQNKGFVTGYMASAAAGETGGHFADRYGITHAIDIGVDIESDGTGLLPTDALVVAEHLRKLGAAGKHPFSRRGYLIHDMSTTTTPLPRIAGFHTEWQWTPYTGASPHSDHIHVTTGGDQVWGGEPQLPPSVYDSRESWGIGTATVTTPATKYYRPVPSFIPVSQDYGSNATQNLPADNWLIKTFGNYQPNGHTGRDYAAATGTDVYAVADGAVVWADWATKLPGDDSHAGWVSRWYISKSFAGIVTIVDHGAFLGVYAHLSDNNIAPAGARVKGGQLIARSGNTGGSTGPHLHFEVIAKPYAWSNGMYGRVNPDRYLTNVTTLAPGYTGATIGSNAPLNPLQEMGIMSQKDFDTYMDSYLDRKSGRFGDSVWKYMIHNHRLGRKEYALTVLGANEDRIRRQAIEPFRAEANKKLDALVSAVNAVLDRSPEALELDPEKAYAEIGRSVVAALKGTQA